MKVLSTLFIIVFAILSAFSQNGMSEIKKDSQSILNHVSKGSIWVLDLINGYTGLGEKDWEFDQTEIVKARNSKGLATLIETTEKIEGTQTWVDVYRAELSYFNNDSLFEYKLKEWNSNTNSWNSEFSYYDEMDAEGKKQINFSRLWDNTSQSFTQGNKEVYSYTDGLLTEKADMDWYNNSWDDYLRTLYYYDEFGNDTLELQQMYIGPGNWRDNWKTKYVYNLEGQKISEQQWGYDSYWEEWFDYSKVKYLYYTENGLVKEETSEGYYDSKIGWEDEMRVNYYYTADDLLDYKEEHDLQDDSYSLRYEYTYDDDNNETSFFLYSWNGSDWSMFYRVYDSYDLNGNQTSFYSQVLDGVWKNNIKEEYTWNSIEADVEDFNAADVHIYPNPVADIIYCNVNNLNGINVVMYDLSGQAVLKQSFKESDINIDISKLPVGVYFLKLSNSEHTFGKKIIKI